MTDDFRMTFTVPGGHVAEALSDALKIGAAMGLTREETLLRLSSPPISTRPARTEEEAA